MIFAIARTCSGRPAVELRIYNPESVGAHQEPSQSNVISRSAKAAGEALSENFNALEIYIGTMYYILSTITILFSCHTLKHSYLKI